MPIKNILKYGNNFKPIFDHTRPEGNCQFLTVSLSDTLRAALITDKILAIN